MATEIPRLIVAHKAETASIRLTKNFWTGEFRCRCHRLGKHPAEGFCGGAVNLSGVLRLVPSLQDLRDVVGPIVITEGGRCWAYHERIYAKRSQKPTLNSAHLYWLGVDVWPATKKIEKTEESRALLKRLGFRGVGWNLKQSIDRHDGLHLDVMVIDGAEWREWD